MADRKTATLMLRIQPTLKQGLRELAARERRSLSNMIEVMILDYGQRQGVPIPELPVVGEQTVPAPKPLFTHPDPSWLGRTP
ncbi:MAG: hypothetical protein RKP73_05905 [Candidatus Contendobacter sp.]|nr:hypothetical protein [Candidatus Contendobacter sp.]